ncbi:MAG TPA: BON domain-containing protein [Candidatus Dormibacteraeota bacterium]|nr:BON domain-containing protein [Candidatus Dormibacteraeota bacterium]
MNLTLAAIIIMGAWVVAIVAAGLVMSLRPGGVPVRLAAAGRSAVDLTGRRDEILLGGDAEVFGNVRGRVQAVRLRPESRELQDVELASDFGLGTQPVPAAAILSADGQVLRLAQAWPEPPIDAPDADGVTLRNNMTVVSAEGKRLGKLRLVCFEPASRLATTLVVAGRGTHARRLLPIDRVKEAGPDRIVTDLMVSEWTSLPPFATAWEIRQAVLQRLTADPELQSLERSLRIEVQDQQVRLEGYVADRAQADRVTQLVRSVPEVLNLDVDLVTDDGLAWAVTDAIARDRISSAARVQVSAHNGTVDITGEAPDRAAAQAIERVGGQVPGVQVLHNMVAVRRPTAATA